MPMFLTKHAYLGCQNSILKIMQPTFCCFVQRAVKVSDSIGETFFICVCVCVCERKLRNSVYLQHMLRQIRDIFAEPFVFHEEVLQFYVLFVLFSFKLCPCKSKLEECSL